MGTVKYTNDTGISLPMAVWLAHDEYQHDPRPNVISVTTLIKPVRRIILESRVNAKGSPVDISTRLASRLGTAVHNGVEYSWTTNYKQALLDLGYPSRAVETIRVNPTEPSTTRTIDVHLEKRSEKQVGNWIVSGQFDMVYDGAVQDVKNTGVFTFMSGIKDKDYINQLSIYRWLNPELITKDTGAIQFIFKDWSPLNAIKEKARNYPSMPILEYRLTLKPVSVVNTWITEKLIQLESYMDKPESTLPLCPEEDLQRSPSVWKHYAKVDSKKATPKGTFTTAHEAYAFLAKKGTGLIKEIKGTCGGCKFCLAKDICSQYQGMLARGEIKA